MKNFAISGLLVALLLPGCGQALTSTPVQAPPSDAVKAERSLKPMSVYVKEQVLKKFYGRVAIPEYRYSISDLEVSETALGHTWTWTCIETVTDFINGGTKSVHLNKGTYSVATGEVRIVSRTPIRR